MNGVIYTIFVCLFVTEATQFCVTAGSTLILKTVQSRELGQSPICCTGGARHYAPRAHNVRSIPYPYMKVTATYNYVAGLQSLQWLLLCPRACQQVSHFRIPKEPD
jgi:hypothetical protein